MLHGTLSSAECHKATQTGAQVFKFRFSPWQGPGRGCRGTRCFAALAGGCEPAHASPRQGLPLAQRTGPENTAAFVWSRVCCCSQGLALAFLSAAEHPDQLGNPSPGSPLAGDGAQRPKPGCFSALQKCGSGSNICWWVGTRDTVLVSEVKLAYLQHPGPKLNLLWKREREMKVQCCAPRAGGLRSGVQLLETLGQPRHATPRGSHAFHAGSHGGAAALLESPTHHCKATATMAARHA